MGVLRVRSGPWIFVFVSHFSYSIFFPFLSLFHLSNQRLLVFHHCFNHRSAPAHFSCLFTQVWWSVPTSPALLLREVQTKPYFRKLCVTGVIGPSLSLFFCSMFCESEPIYYIFRVPRSKSQPWHYLPGACMFDLCLHVFRVPWFPSTLQKHAGLLDPI